MYAFGCVACVYDVCVYVYLWMCFIKLYIINKIQRRGRDLLNLYKIDWESLRYPVKVNFLILSYFSFLNLPNLYNAHKATHTHAQHQSVVHSFCYNLACYTIWMGVTRTTRRGIIRFAVRILPMQEKNVLCV